MAKTRSPNYPAVSLPEAIKRARMVWDKERHGKMAQEVAVKHMGYNTLNGASMGVVSALRKYGLLDGDGSALKLSPAALSILHDPVDSPERKEALRKAAFAPTLFQEFHEEFGDHVPSEENLRSYLLKRGFIPSAAAVANRSYRETMALVEEEAGDYNPGGVDEESAPKEDSLMPPVTTQATKLPQPAAAPAPAGYRQEVSVLAEGDAILRWPENLSKESFEDFSGWLELVLRKVARAAGADWPPKSR